MVFVSGEDVRRRSRQVVPRPNPSGQARLGWFFIAEHAWAGDPVNCEPFKHAELVWIDPGAPRPDVVAYTWAGLTAWRSGVQFAVHWQEPGSPVHYDPGRVAAVVVPRFCSRARSSTRIRKTRPHATAMVRLASDNQFPMNRPSPMTARRIPA